MSETADAPPLIDILGLLTADGPAVIRSLYLWQQILGPDSGAAERLADVLDPMIGLPIGSDVAPHVIPVPLASTGKVLLVGCMPGGDAAFEGFTEEGLRLTGVIDPAGDNPRQRRFQLLGAEQQPHRRQAGQRVMLRYTLPPPALVARQLMFAALTRRAPGTAPEAVLRIWVEIEQNGASLKVPPTSVQVGAMSVEATLHLFSYEHQALLVHIDRTTPVIARLMIELIATPIEIDLLGEALVISG
jgi:hypothetical protein